MEPDKKTLLYKFLLPSLLGVVIFLVPIRIEGKTTILMGFFADLLNKLLQDYIAAIIVVLVCFSSVVTIYTTYLAPKHNINATVSRLFYMSGIWVFLRTLGALLSLATIFQIGPEALWSDSTGGIILYQLASVILVILFLAGMLLPLLTDFGLMEYIGTLSSRLFRVVFALPGRSAVDAVASWMAAASVGVLITTQQYEKGYYSGREAAVIATNFSVVSIPFCLIIVNFVGLSHLFIAYYLTVVSVGFINAIIIPRLPPLSRIPDTYYEPVGKQLHNDENPKAGKSLFKNAVDNALVRAKASPDLVTMLKQSCVNVLDIWFGILPIIFPVGIFGLILVEYTSLFDYLAYPLVFLLEFLKVPEANAAAPAMLIGFIDMFLPAVIGKSIESELTRFVIACLSVTQLIYMSEIGIWLIRSKIPLGFWTLLKIFLLRTIVGLPIITAIAHLIVFS